MGPEKEGQIDGTLTLYRVLRFLAGHGILEEVAPHRFALTTLGAPLRSDVPGSRVPSSVTSSASVAA